MRTKTWVWLVSWFIALPYSLSFVSYNIFIAMHFYSNGISSFYISKFSKISSVAFFHPKCFRDISRQLKNMMLRHVITCIYYPYKWQRLCDNHGVFACLYTTLRARFTGPSWGKSGSCRPQVGPCRPHEPCYLGSLPVTLSVCNITKNVYTNFDGNFRIRRQ